VEEEKMPKMKTHKGVSGRFEVTKKGKLKRRKRAPSASGA
jgi:ribosomal protein L35